MRDRTGSWLLAGFAFIVVAFVTSTLIQSFALGVGGQTSSLLGNALPSVRLLSDARFHLSSIQRALTSGMSSEAELGRMEREADEAFVRLRDALARESATPNYPGEAELNQDAWRLFSKLRTALDEWKAAGPRDRPALADDAARVAYGVESRLALLDEINLTNGQKDARQLEVLSRRSVAIGLWMDFLATVLAAATFLLIRRLLRRHVLLLEKTQQYAEHRAEELESFAGRVAHDLRNPLSALSLSVALLNQPETEGPQREAAFRRAKVGMARCNALIEGLLAFARAGGAPIPGARAEVGLVVQEVSEAAAGEGVRLRTLLEPAWAACPRGVLSSICANLVENALKYTRHEPDPQVEVRVSRRTDHILLEVEDNGPGVPADMRERVFEPFVRVGDADQPGLGLGLATVKKLATAYGGQVGARPAARRGAIFWVVLPAADREPEEAALELPH